MRRAVVPALLAVALLLAGCGEDDFQPGERARPAGLLRVPDLSGGYTVRIELDPRFRRAARTASGGLRPTGDATLEGATLTLPISGGMLRVEPRGEDAPAVSGRIDLDGSGVRVRGRRTATLEDLQLTPGDGTVVAKLVEGGRTEDGTLPVLRFVPVTTRPLRLSETDAGAVLEGTRVRLMPGGARVLRRALGTGAPRAGTVVGEAKVTIDRDGP